MDLSELKKQYGGKNVLVVGLGLQGGGAGVAKFFANLGANVRATDLKTADTLSTTLESLRDLQITYTLGKHKLEDFLWADVIFKGPIVPWELPELVAAEKNGTPIEMELSFFASHCLSPIIGITGTRGKSTTTAMIYKILHDAGKSVHLAGSIPQLSTIELLEKIKKDDAVVMELPSWPLSGFHRKKISPKIAVFTNLYPDHLNYYKSMEEYFYDKSAIFLYQKPGDDLIINSSLETSLKDLPINSKIHFFSKESYTGPKLLLPGEHNRENAAAAEKAALTFGINITKIHNTLASFTGLSYRIETILDTDKLTVINDTTSTTPVATMTAIETFKDRKIILILGGRDKNLPYDGLLPKLQNVHSIVLLKGSFTDKILPSLQSLYPDKLSPVYDDLRDAYKAARKTCETITDTKPLILFSPGATSFAMFNNEFHRGSSFNTIVCENS